jgi:predicted aspartyl protease
MAGTAGLAEGPGTAAGRAKAMREGTAMGKVLVTAKIENLMDLYNVEQGRLNDDQVRRVEIADAVADTGAMMLSLPKSMIERLGLKRHRTRRVRTSGGLIETGSCEAVRLSVQSRDCTVDVIEVPDDCPVLLGQVPLELMDFVVDPVNRRLVGNPEHGGDYMIDLF